MIPRFRHSSCPVYCVSICLTPLPVSKQSCPLERGWRPDPPFSKGVHIVFAFCIYSNDFFNTNATFSRCYISRMDASLQKELKRKLWWLGPAVCFLWKGRWERLAWDDVFDYFTELQKRQLKAQEKGDLIEESKLCNAAGELLAQHGKLSYHNISYVFVQLVIVC